MTPDEGDRRPIWPRHLLLAGAAVALLMLGAAVGMLVGLPGSSAPGVPAADSVDVGFAQDMTVHHEQAVQMASWEREHTADARLRQLAYDIETGQSRQIGHMQGWLALWGAAALPTDAHMRWMTAEDGDHGHAGMASGPAGVDAAGVDVAIPGMDRMPGMATEDELRRLRAASGQALDVLFLQLMLRHHEGGTGMLSYAARYASVPDVRNLAGQMLASQTAEGQYLRQLLAEHGAAPLPG